MVLLQYDCEDNSQSYEGKSHHKSFKLVTQLPMASFRQFQLSYTVFHLAVLCDSLRCGAYGTFCYGIS